MSRELQNKTTLANYCTRMSRVCEFIESHLDEELSVELLSHQAHFSKYHFHRQFSAYVGVTVAKYILMMRLKRASYQLVYHPELRIIDIAYNACFENPESFSRTFKKNFEQTPSQFRQEPLWHVWHRKQIQPRQGNLNEIERGILMNIEIIDVEKIAVAVLEHRGAPELLNHSISEFIAWRKSSSLSPVDRNRSFGIAFDDPSMTKPENFRFDICGEVFQLVPKNEYQVINKHIPAGRCARIRHHGPHDQMDNKIRALYQQWLPQSGEQLRDFPCYFHYINLFPEVSEYELITDIYLPLK